MTHTLSATTVRKIFATGFILIFAVMAGYLLYAATILLWSDPKDVERHDAIIVLTGAKGRIGLGFELLLEEKAPTLFITGVLDQTSFDDMVSYNSENLTSKQIETIRTHCCITLDYKADTTATNATEAVRWVKDNNIKSFIMVTSSTHMPRAYLQFHSVFDNDITITAYPYNDGRKLDLVRNPDFWHYTAREYFKFIGTLVSIGIPNKNN